MKETGNSKPHSTRIRRVDDPQFQAEILALYREGLSIQEISRRLAFAYPSIYNWLKVSGYATSLSRKKACRVPIIRQASGYRFIHMPKHSNADANGYVREHVLVASKALGRALTKGEVVHHINGDKLDNHNCNLLICDRAYHEFLHKRMAMLYQKEHFPTLSQGV